jgi:putative phosphoesterase
VKYLLLSDIHGSLPRLERALDFYRSRRCDMMLLLGDILNYGPHNGIPEGMDSRGVAERLNAMADDIVAVRGNRDEEADQELLNFSMLADYALLVDEGRKVLLTHGHIYNRDHLPRGRYDAVLTAHTHVWRLEDDGRTLFCNTGSITFPKGGNPPTLGIMENGRIAIYTLDGELVKQAVIPHRRG